jgi:hypothetical protein
VKPLSAPAKRGRGTTLRSGVVEGAQDSTRRKSLGDVQTFSLASPAKRIFRNDNEAPSPARRHKPPSLGGGRSVGGLRPPFFYAKNADAERRLREGRRVGVKARIARCDSLRSRAPHPASLRAATLPLQGRVKKAISFPRRIRVRVLPTKATVLLPPKKKGRRSAEKAHQSSVLSGARPRAERSALAFRRSTAALASAMCRSSVRAALRAMQCAGVSCALASRLSEAPRAPVVMPAGSMPGPPGSGSDEPPPAGTAPAPSVGVTG